MNEECHSLLTEVLRMDDEAMLMLFADVEPVMFVCCAFGIWPTVWAGASANRRYSC